MGQDLNKAIREARARYTDQGIDFDKRVKWYLENGWVISLPHCFALGYFYKESGNTIAFVGALVGNILTLKELSLDYTLDIIEFKRNFSDRTRRYNYRKFIKKL